MLRCSRVCAEIKADRNQGIDDCSFCRECTCHTSFVHRQHTLGAHSTHWQSAVGNSAYCCYSNSGEKLLFLFINDDLILNTSCRLKCSYIHSRLRLPIYRARSRNRYNFFHPKTQYNILYTICFYFPIILSRVFNCCHRVNNEYAATCYFYFPCLNHTRSTMLTTHCEAKFGLVPKRNECFDYMFTPFHCATNFNFITSEYPSRPNRNTEFL